MNIIAEQTANNRVFRKFFNNYFENEECYHGGILLPNSFDIPINERKIVKADNGDIEIVKKSYVTRKYNLIESNILLNLGKSRKYLPYLILGLIGSKIRYNSNVVYIDKKLIDLFLDLNISYRDYASALDYLKEFNIIRSTDYKSIYAVNPLIIFKGDINVLAQFITNEKFMTAKLENNKLCVDKVIIFRTFKDKDGILIKNKKYFGEETNNKRGINDISLFKINFN